MRGGAQCGGPCALGMSGVLGVCVRGQRYALRVVFAGRLRGVACVCRERMDTVLGCMCGEQSLGSEETAVPAPYPHGAPFFPAAV